MQINLDLIFKPSMDFKYGKAFTYAGIRVVVAADVVEVLEEFSAYLPESKVASIDSPYEITHSIDSALAIELKKLCCHGPKIQIKEDLFYKTHAVDGCVLYSSLPSNLSEQHVIVKRGRRISIVCCLASEDAIRTPLRVFREILLRSLENAGGILVHAAAVQLANGDGVLIVGDAKAGKTSTMCQLVLKNKAKYIANDRCIIYMENGNLHCVGWPFAIRLGIGFMEDMNLLETADLSSLRRTQADHILESVEISGATEWGSTSKLELTPSEFCEKFRCQHAESAPLRKIIFPKLNPSGARMKIASANAENYLTLTKNIREPFDPDFLRGWLGIRAVDDEQIDTNVGIVTSKLLKMQAVCLDGDPRGNSFPTLFM